MKEHRLEQPLSHWCTAGDCARYLLGGTSLTDYDASTLEVAIQYAIDVDGQKVTEIHCLNELVQMQHRPSVESLARTLTGLKFQLSWRGEARGDHNKRRFFIDHVTHLDPMTREDFDALAERNIWGTDRHRRALGILDAEGNFTPNIN